MRCAFAVDLAQIVYRRQWKELVYPPPMHAGAQLGIFEGKGPTHKKGTSKFLERR